MHAPETAAPTPTAPAPTAGRWRGRLARVALALLVAVAVYVGYALLYGSRLGELCETAADCSWSGLGDRICLQMYWGYCTRRCASASDCPPGWRCEPKHPQGSLCLLRRR